MLDDKHTLSATSISLLILQELKLMRQDMKDGLTNLRQANCNKCKGNGKVGNNNDGVAFTLPVVATHEKSGEENPINHIESALDSHKPSKELEHNNCKIPPNATSSDRLELARTSINEEKLKGMSLLENSALKIEKPSGEYSDIRPALLSEAQPSELSDLQIGCVYGNLYPSASVATTCSNANSISNANRDTNIDHDTVVALPVVAAERKHNGFNEVVKKDNIHDHQNTARATENVQSHFRPVCPNPITQQDVLSWQYYYNHFHAKTQTGDFRNDNTAITGKRKKLWHTCKHCGRNFDSYYKKQQHVALAHQPKVVCSYCNQVFVHKQHMIIHVRRKHTGEKPFSCKVCGKKFPCRGDRNQHVKTCVPVTVNEYM